jgi:hypothetical protein
MFYNVTLEMSKKTPKKKQQKPSRLVRWFLYPLIGLVFVFFLSVLLMLANGFLPDIKNGKVSFKKTGMIIVAARPLDASIYINGKYKEKTTFYMLQNKLNNLIPGSYVIRIEKNGYRTWEKTINVAPGLVSWANYVLMFADKLDIKSVPELLGTPLVVSENGRHLLYTGTKDNKFFALSHDTSGLAVHSFWPNDTSALPEWLKVPQVVSALYNQNGDKVIYQIKNGDITEFVVAETVGNDTKLIILNEQMAVSPLSVSWNPYENDTVFITLASSLYSQKISSNSIGNPIASNIVSYKYEQNRQLYTAVKATSGNVSIEKSNLDGNNRVVILDSIAPASGYQFAHTNTGDSLAIRNIDTGDLLLVYPANGENNVILRLGKGYKKIAWQKNGQKLLYYNDDTIYRYDVEKKKETHYLYKGKISSVAWYFDDCHYLVNGDLGLEIVEYDGGNSLNLSFTPALTLALDSQNYMLVYEISKDKTTETEYLRFTSPY